MKLQPYSDFAPTCFDTAGAFLEDDRQDWLVGPCSQTRDSGPLDESNYASMIAALREADPSGEDWEEHRFGHWGPGWFEIAIARPDSTSAGVLEECARALANYPVLDDDDHSERELEAQSESWAAWGASAVADAILDRRGIDVSDVDRDALFSAVQPEWEHDGDGFTLRPNREAKRCTEDELLALPGARWDEEVLGPDGQPDDDAIDLVHARAERRDAQETASRTMRMRGHRVPYGQRGDAWAVGHPARSWIECSECGARATVNVRPAEGAPLQDRLYGPALDGARCTGKRTVPSDARTANKDAR